MPFITKKRRVLIELQQLKREEMEPGDRCYIYYKNFVERWRSNPRWATVDKIYRDILNNPIEDSSDAYAARSLAWQVFFQLYVMPYELKKRKENGDV